MMNPPPTQEYYPMNTSNTDDYMVRRIESYVI